MSMVISGKFLCQTTMGQLWFDQGAYYLYDVEEGNEYIYGIHVVNNSLLNQNGDVVLDYVPEV